MAHAECGGGSRARFGASSASSLAPASNHPLTPSIPAYCASRRRLCDHDDPALGSAVLAARVVDHLMRMVLHERYLAKAARANEDRPAFASGVSELLLELLGRTWRRETTARRKTMQVVEVCGHAAAVIRIVAATTANSCHPLPAPDHLRLSR